MSYDKACKAMLDGIAAAIAKMKPSSLSLIRIVIMEQPVFQAFRFEIKHLHNMRVHYTISIVFPIIFHRLNHPLCVCRKELANRFGQITPCRISLRGLL